jgi:tetratricopeptide (TPR) repeat protein
MNRIKIFFLVVAFASTCFRMFGQDPFIRGLEQKVAHAKSDSERVYALIEWSRRLYTIDSVQSAFSIALKAIDAANKSQSSVLRNEAILLHAYLFTAKGEYLPALNLLETIETSVNKSVNMDQKKNFFITKGRVLSNLGRYSEALKYSLEALELTERAKDTVAQSKVLNNIGILYDYTGDKKKALSYYMKSLTIKLSLGDDRGAANSYANIGDIYRVQRKFDSSLYYTTQCLEIGKSMADNNILSLAYSNLGSTYAEMMQFQKALEYINAALEVDSLLGEQYGVCLDLIAIGQTYVNLKEYAKAKPYLELGLKKAHALHSIENIKNAYQMLAQLYSETGRYKEAFNFYKEFKRYNDTIFNMENSRQFNDLKTQYEVDKKTAELEQKSFEEKVRHEQEIKQQKLILYFVSFAGVLVLALLLLSIRAYREKKKTNKIIVQQKDLVEQKNKEILDSIYYAKRIQKSLLPTEKYLERNIKKPKA